MYTARIYAYIQNAYFSVISIALSSAADIIGSILGLASQTEPRDKAQHSTAQHSTKGRREEGERPARRSPLPRAIAIAIDRRQLLSFAPSFAWLPRRPVPFESREHSPPEPLHHPTTNARARHYHQLDRCHRRRQQTIIHHRPTLTDIFSVVALSTHTLTTISAAPSLLPPPDRPHLTTTGHTRDRGDRSA